MNLRYVHRTSVVVSSAVLFLLILHACSGSDDITGASQPRLAIHAGDAQAAMFGQALPAPLQVSVATPDGSPVANLKVNWGVVAGGGSLSASSSTTGEDGMASVTWTLGPTGSQQVKAWLDVGGAEPVIFSASPSNPPGLVRIKQSDMTLTAGASSQLAADVLDANGASSAVLAGLHVSWLSSDTRVVAVGPDGALLGVGTGKAFVIARYLELADTVSITVVPPPVASLSLWPASNVLFTGMTRTLSLAVTRGSTTGSEPAESWTVADGSVATVENGILTAVGVGHTTITAKLENQTSPPIDVYVVAAPSPPLRFSATNGTCALTTDGLLYCWGNAFPGMAGPFDSCRLVTKLGTTYYNCSAIPRLVSSDLRFKAMTGVLPLSPGPGMIPGGCAVTTDGAIYCWGDNAYGELGLGSADDQMHGLTRIPVDGEFVEVAASEFTRCARRVDGVIFCWGSNLRGDAGVGSPDVGLHSLVAPTPISTSARFVKLGSKGNCGLATDSTAYCWGSFVGDVALEGCNTACSLSPVQVNSEKLVDLDTKDTYCGIGVSGRAFCWGFHGFDPYRYAEPQEVSNPGFSSFEPGLNAIDASGAGFALTDYGALWSFRPVDTGDLRFKKFWGGCGIALDDKLYCGTGSAQVSPIPGQ